VIGGLELVSLVVLVIAGFVVPIIIAVALVRWWINRDRTPTQDPGAILRDRLARGEITQDQFDAALVALGYPPRDVGPPAG
jgi:uncharacterized membrane protein